MIVIERFMSKYLYLYNTAIHLIFYVGYIIFSFNIEDEFGESVR